MRGTFCSLGALFAALSVPAHSQSSDNTEIEPGTYIDCAMMQYLGAVQESIDTDGASDPGSALSEIAYLMGRYEAETGEAAGPALDRRASELVALDLEVEVDIETCLILSDRLSDIYGDSAEGLESLGSYYREWPIED